MLTLLLDGLATIVIVAIGLSLFISIIAIPQFMLCAILLGLIGLAGRALLVKLGVL